MTILLRPNKKISVFRITGLKIVGRVVTYIFLIIFQKKKRNILCILKMHKIIFFPENLKKILGFTSKFRKGPFSLNTGIFFIWPYQLDQVSSLMTSNLI